jgi:integrase
LPQRAVEALRIHRKRQLEEPHKVVSATWQDYGLVFASSKGTPLDTQNIVNKRLNPLLERAGISDIRWHGLATPTRPCYCPEVSIPKYIQQSLGHASIQLTLDRYSHWMTSAWEDMALTAWTRIGDRVYC